jgi:hypothetical protein
MSRENPVLWKKAMRRSRAACLLLAFPTTFWAQQDAAEVYRQAKDAVVLIETEHRIGTGVIVSADGWIVTNYHVVAGERSITIRFASGLGLVATELVASDSDADLAVLKLNGTGFAHLDLGDSDSLAIGQRIFVISSPMGLQGSVTEGLISAVREIRGAKRLQISAPISPGSSGGPVLDQAARVVGIATATIEGAQNLNLAIPASTIQALLRKPQPTAKLSDLASPGTNEQAVSQAEPILRNVGRYLRNEMIDEAESQLRMGVQQFEFNPALRLELAKLLIRTGKPEDALQQLKISNKLVPDEWVPAALLGDLYLKRWLHDEEISDWLAACHLYEALLAKSEMPKPKRDLIENVLRRMRSPVGEWSDGFLQYSVSADSEGKFHINRPEDVFSAAFNAHRTERLLLNFPYDGEFHATDEPRTFAGETSYMDQFCSEKQSLQITIRPDGSFMDISGTLIRVTGVMRTAIKISGKKRAEGMCKNRKPGDAGLRLTLFRVLGKQASSANALAADVDLMLSIDAQPMIWPNK